MHGCIRSPRGRTLSTVSDDRPVRPSTRPAPRRAIARQFEADLSAPVLAAGNRLPNVRQISERVAMGRALWRELVIGFAGQLGELRLGFTQLAALYVLADGSTLTIGELAESIGRSPSATSRLVDGLVRHHLVEHHQEPMRFFFFFFTGKVLCSEAKTTKACRLVLTGCTSRSSARSQTGSITAKGLQLFNRMALSVPTDPKYLERVRRFAGFYMGEDPDAPNYDPKYNIIRSMMNGSKGPLLRKATAIEWVGEPFDMVGFDALHGERNFDEFVAHYREYHDVVGDHALNLVATTLPANAYFATGDQKYKKWVTTYVDGWLERMKQNNGIIPTFVDLDGKVGGPTGKWWGSAYGWGFSPVNPVTNKRENRNRMERPIIGLNNALLLTGDQKYVDAWRDMTNAINANARTVDGKTQYPTMYGLDLTANPKATKAGWYGWRDRPWNVGALEVWYFSQKPADLERVTQNPWLEYLQGRNPGFPETAMAEDLAEIKKRVEGIRKDQSKWDKRLADNMLDLNPVTTTSLIQLTQGGLEPDRRGNLVNSRLRYFDPARKRAGLPEDVGALISEMSDTGTVVTLVNLNTTTPRTLVVQGGAYAEHVIESVDWNGKTIPVGKPNFTVTLSPGAGGKLSLNMKRYAGDATVKFPF